MSLPEVRQPGYTLEDWQSWDGRWELINGIAYDLTPAPSLEHQTICSDLLFAIRLALLGGRIPVPLGESGQA